MNVITIRIAAYFWIIGNTAGTITLVFISGTLLVFQLAGSSHATLIAPVHIDGIARAAHFCLLVIG